VNIFETQCRTSAIGSRHGTGSLGHQVNGLSFTSGSSGHHFDPVWDRSFSPIFENMPKMQNVHLKCWNDKSHCQVSVVGLISLDVSPCNELLLLPVIIKNSLDWEYFFTHKSSFGEQSHRVIWVSGSLDSRVTGSLGHKMWPGSISGSYTMSAL